MINTKKCLICKNGSKNDCLHWHEDTDTGMLWVYCVGKCQRGYSLYDYCAHAGISLKEFLQNDFEFEEAKPNEVRKMEWPAWFLPLHDRRSQSAIDYIKTRGLDIHGDMFYDSDSHGIVFPYYFHSTFVGAQIRLIVPRSGVDGEIQKMDTLPGTRLGLLFYNFDQSHFSDSVTGVIVTEGAFNSLSIQQALNDMYGSRERVNPWRCIATSGSGLSDHQVEVLSEYKQKGLAVVMASDSDEAGMKMLRKAHDKECITHYSLTEYTDIDWNDVLMRDGNTGLAQFFMKGIKRVS